MRPIDADSLLDKLLRHYTEQEKKGNLSFVACEIKQSFADMVNEATTIEPRWIPVTERLPEIVKITHAYTNEYRKSSRVLCACLQADGKRIVKEGYMEFSNYNPKPNWRIPGTIHSVTHWMPLPEAPKEE